MEFVVNPNLKIPEDCADPLTFVISHVVGKLATRFKFPGHTPEDIAQVAWCIALEALQLDYYDKSRPLDAYLYRHCFNRLCNYGRQFKAECKNPKLVERAQNLNQPVSTELLHENALPTKTPYYGLEFQEFLEGLAPTSQTILLLHLERKSVKAIAEAVDLPVANVKRIINFCKERAREYF